MADSDLNLVLNKTVKRNIRTLKPYEKKFCHPGDFRYELPLPSVISPGYPTVCYDRSSKIKPRVTAQSTNSASSSTTTRRYPQVADVYVTDILAHSSDNVIEDESFLDPGELYFHLLKSTKGISIFSGINGSGSVLVIKDFSLEKQTLQKDKWVLVERKCATFSDAGSNWIYWCSCNQTFARQISALDCCLNTSHDDFLGQYSDCLHVKVAKMVFGDFDLKNCIEPTANINTGNDPDHEYARTRNILYEVPDSALICCYATDIKRFGLVEIRNQRFICQTCTGKSYTCKHVSEMNSLKTSGDYQFLDIMNDTESRTNIPSSYSPKLLSYKKIKFDQTPQLTEGLKNLPNSNLTTLVPEEKMCRHCNSSLEEGDPIEKNWIAYESVVVVTNTEITYGKSYYRPCSSCDVISFFDGQSKCLLNLGTYLVGYDVLRSYMHSFLHGRRPLHTFYQTFCDVHIDYGHAFIKDVFTYQHLRYAWLFYLDLLDLDFTEGFSCPKCSGDDGEPPSVVICDGTSISFQRRMWQWEDLKEEKLKKLNLSSFSERIFIKELATRKLLQRYVADGQFVRGKKLKPLEKKEKAILFAELKSISLPLYDLLKEIEIQSKIPEGYKKLILSIASPSPVCGYLHPTKEVENLITQIFKEVEVKQNPTVFSAIHTHIPVLFDIVEVYGVQDNLKLLLKELWHVAINPFVDAMEDEESNESIKFEEMSFFPSLPKKRNRGVFQEDTKSANNKSKRKDSTECSKKYSGHPSLLPGIFTIFCPHGVCYGYQVMESNESPNVPFTIFRTRFKKAPKHIIYDNACKLHSYCISRDPQFFKDTQFYVDRLHWDNHTSCSVGYNLSLYHEMDYINSQLNEQANAGLQRIKDQLSYMTANNFMKHSSFYLWNKNKQKVLQQES